MVEAPRGVQCVVVTPERALLDERADLVVVPLYDGELGVLPGRAPLIGRLGCGELRLRRGDRTEHVYVDGGFVQVRSDTVTVLTPRALRAAEINAEAARAVLREPPPPTPTAETAEQRRRDQDRARAQLRVAGHRDSPGGAGGTPA
jgi:F-type H+-transporting ATPase subunit epsilon